MLSHSVLTTTHPWGLLCSLPPGFGRGNNLFGELLSKATPLVSHLWVDPSNVSAEASAGRRTHLAGGFEGAPNGVDGVCSAEWAPGNGGKGSRGRGRPNNLSRTSKCICSFISYSFNKGLLSIGVTGTLRQDCYSQ